MGNMDSKINIISKLSSSELDTDVKSELLTNYLKKEGGDDAVFDKIFGKQHAEMYIALIVAIFVLVAGVVCTFVFKSNEQLVKELWQIFVPALTLVVGYMFGVK